MYFLVQISFQFTALCMCQVFVLYIHWGILSMPRYRELKGQEIFFFSELKALWKDCVLRNTQGEPCVIKYLSEALCVGIF